jgi:hypothetical protein
LGELASNFEAFDPAQGRALSLTFCQPTHEPTTSVIQQQIVDFRSAFLARIADNKAQIAATKVQIAANEAEIAASAAPAAVCIALDL